MHKSTLQTSSLQQLTNSNLNVSICVCSIAQARLHFGRVVRCVCGVVSDHSFMYALLATS